MQRMLSTQNGKIPLSRQQEDRKEYYAWFSSNFIIPPTLAQKYIPLKYPAPAGFFHKFKVLK